MTRIMVGSLTAAAGYLLVYAAVYRSGKYVLDPWRALREDV